MLVDTQKRENIIEEEHVEQEKDKDIQIIVDDIVEDIIQINQQKKHIQKSSVINLVDEDEIIDVEGEWESSTKVHPIIENIFGSESDQTVRSVLELVNDDPAKPLVKCENNRANSPSKNCKVTQRQSTLPEYYFVQNSTIPHDSKDAIQKVLPIDSKTGILDSINITDKCFMKAKVVIERLPSNLTRPNILTKIKGYRSHFVKKSKLNPLYSCSDCRYKTSKKKNMVFHLDDTSHSSVICGKLVISNGDFYRKKFNKINDNCKTEANKHYGLRQRYTTKWFPCTYNECDFTTNSWRLMYNHVKFAHLQMWKSRNYRNRERILIKDTPKVDKDDKKLFMNALVIVRRLPTYIINQQISKRVNPWSPHIKIEQVRKSSFGNGKKANKYLHLPAYHKTNSPSTAHKKYSCAFNKCMFVTNHWKIMYRHVKLWHIPLTRNCNMCSYKTKQKKSQKSHKN